MRTPKTFRLCLEWEQWVPGSFNLSGEYHLTYNSWEHNSDKFSEGLQLPTQCNCLFVGLDLGHTSEETVAALVERELAMHNKPNLQVSIVPVHSNTDLYKSQGSPINCDKYRDNTVVYFSQIKMVTGNQF